MPEVGKVMRRLARAVLPLGRLQGGCARVVESGDDQVAGANSSREQTGLVRGGQRACLVE